MIRLILPDTVLPRVPTATVYVLPAFRYRLLPTCRYDYPVSDYRYRLITAVATFDHFCVDFCRLPLPYLFYRLYVYTFAAFGYHLLPVSLPFCSAFDTGFLHLLPFLPLRVYCGYLPADYRRFPARRVAVLRYTCAVAFRSARYVVLPLRLPLFIFVTFYPFVR